MQSSQRRIQALPVLLKQSILVIGTICFHVQLHPSGDSSSAMENRKDSNLNAEPGLSPSSHT